MSDLDAALDKAVEAATAAPTNVDKAAGTSTDAPSKSEGDDTAAGKATEVKDPAKAPVKERAVWDGKLESVDALPEDLREAAREHAKAVQRYTTKLSQEAAEARKKAEDYERKYPADRQAQYERWLQEQAKPKPNEAPRISQGEWEDALLDPTGDKVNGLIDRQIQWKVEQARRAYLDEVKKTETAAQERRSLEDKVLEFASLNPAFEKLAKAGIMMPLLKDELGKPGGTLETAYARALQLVDSFKAERDAELKSLTEKKKDASTFDKGGGHDDTVKWVNNHEEALEASIENAIMHPGRKMPVKVRPRKP
jgi:hypothetical protein